MHGKTAHVDTFAQDHLPAAGDLPEFRFPLPELIYPPQINVAEALMDSAIADGHGGRPALHSQGTTWSYAETLERSCRIAHVLVEDLGLVPGNRVLLRGPNSPILAAAWLGVLRCGAIAVTTTPLLRAKELAQIAVKARIDHALCDMCWLGELTMAQCETGYLRRLLTWGGGLEDRMERKAAYFRPVATAADDVALLAFTSGTTGTPKATIHFHRDVLAMSDVVARHLLNTRADDIYIGSPPLGFTFGLGALLVFPLRFRAAAAYVAQTSVEGLLTGVQQFGATCLFSAPTMYRALAQQVCRFDISSLRQCVSAGEPLSKATSDAWYGATGIRLIDGIGSTEMLHIFIGASGGDIRPGSIGRPLPGYEAVVLDEHGASQGCGSGRLAVRGPTGCRYLDDARQRDYVQNGWNVTADRCRIDEAGYFWFEARDDDMIVSAGYNIAAPEVENSLLTHPAVRECAVVGSPDPERGQIVKAFIVLNVGHAPDADLVEALQRYVKRQIAPYKYPRTIQFVDELPKTSTGKLQRSLLHAAELEHTEKS
jgi:2-aminobenzoate-CoA ligase